MSGKAFNFVKKFNQYLFCIGALLALGTVAHSFYQKVSRDRSYQTPKVEVVQKNDPAAVEIKKTNQYVTRIKDIYVFDVVANKIIQQEEKGAAEIQNFFSGASSDYYHQGSVNVLFAIPNEEPYLLFENDKYIEDRILADFSVNKYEYNSYRIEKNLYKIAEKDTNQDGFLSGKDVQSLYLSDYNGRNLTLVLDRIDQFRLIEDHTVLIVQGAKENKVFYIFNTNTNDLKKLNTQP